MPLRTEILEVLVAENHHASLGYQKRQLVLLAVAQIAQLETPDLGPDPRRDRRDGHIGIPRREEMGFGLVGEGALVHNIERLERWEVGAGVEDGEIGGVFVLMKLVRERQLVDNMDGGYLHWNGYLCRSPS